VSLRRIGIRAGLAAPLLALLAPARAEAHLVSTGLGPVYDGIGHMLTTPEDLIPAIALALLAGLRGAGPGRRALFLLPAAWFAGGLAGLQIHAAAAFPLPAISFLLLGILVAVNAPLTARGVAAIAIGLGIAHGFFNGSAFQDSSSGAPALAGEAAILFALVALVSAFVVSLERPWARIAVRVSGSWIAAVGLLLLGWALRGAPGSIKPGPPGP
jgi:urease accessory protein